MNHLGPILLRTGGPVFLPHSTTLKAGPLRLLLEQGELRRIRLGDVEIIRRIYLAVRGSDWRTIPSMLSDLKVEAQEASFRVSYTLSHRQDEFDFTWRVSVEGDGDGRIAFLAKGQSASAFATNRVGMCVLHPPRECVGRPVRATSPDGTVRESRFPDIVSPYEPFKDLRKFSHQLESGTWVDLDYQGEVFEMEDQRNWTDGSFKTYCPPAHLPKPRKIEPGWETEQGVTLEIRFPEGALASVPGAAEISPASLSLESGKTGPLPALGMSLASHGRPAGPKDSVRIRSMAPAHLRANFRLDDPGLPAAIVLAKAEAGRLGAPLEAAIVVGDDVEGGLAAFAAEWKKSEAEAIRWLVFHGKSDSTPEAVLQAAWRHLRDVNPGAGFALGSKNDFVLLNRGRPALTTEPARSSSLVYAMCPQVHAFDNRNLVESLEGQEWTLRTAGSLWPRNPVSVSTISLKRSPFAASLKLAGSPPPDAWLKQADPRQVSLFAAGWTLASIKRLAVGGAASATYYETTGPLGIMAGENCTPEEMNFPGMDFKLEGGWVFPVYHVFADLAEFKGGEVDVLEPSHPLRCDGIALSAGGRRSLLIANLEETYCKARVEGLPASVRIRRLNDKSARMAVEEPERYRALPMESGGTTEGALELDLAPFEYLRLDL